MSKTVKSNSSSEILVESIANLALAKKAEDVIAIKVAELTSISDYFVICSASTDVQVKAIADGIRKGTDTKAWKVEGYEQLNWVLLDYVDVIVHIFRTSERQYYQIERLWADAKKIKYND